MTPECQKGAGGFCCAGPVWAVLWALLECGVGVLRGLTLFVGLGLCPISWG